ncbi:hypothetical protein RBSH_05814 [Rhodopirellula baltica SH28]|uniref:Secreted protein n=1 Tax=Rhodopirellula baltica SH28 TaxID=993517 RepID=K5D7Z4_RHOBT|nr:hypothetical protein RBSH_05814 [Rhodopirellula baltica SH28]
MFFKAFSMASLKTTAFALPSFVTELQAQHEPVNDFPCKRFRSDEQSGNHCTSQCASTHSLCAYSSTYFLYVVPPDFLSLVPPTKKSWLTETRCSPKHNCHAAGTQLNSPLLLHGAIHRKFRQPMLRSARCLL